MRQAGVLAAPGLVALRTMVERLADDHARAARLAEAVAERWPDCRLDPASVRTNIVTFPRRCRTRCLAHLRLRASWPAPSLQARSGWSPITTSTMPP